MATSLRDSVVALVGETTLLATEAYVCLYPGATKCEIVKFAPLSATHPDRFTRGTQPAIEYTHTVDFRYCDDWGCLFGVTTDKKMHLWMD